MFLCGISFSPIHHCKRMTVVPASMEGENMTLWYFCIKPLNQCSTESCYILVGRKSSTTLNGGKPIVRTNSRSTFFSRTLYNIESQCLSAHINNLYNTVFWALIQQGGMTAQEAHKTLSGTVSSEKNEILFSRYGINYNTLAPIYKRGSIILWEPPAEEAGSAADAQATGLPAEELTHRVSVISSNSDELSG